MALNEYRQKRDFRKTAEPRGEKSPRSSGELSFVVQKHAASHLHYDFRLEWDGVLKSWAVPKGPDLDPANKRLAMQVEDHPLEYGGFEGIIPEGEYGGGTVMVWDKGVWEPIDDPDQGLKEGHLKFILHGEKLKGGWMLVRKGGRKAEEGERRWFLFKERDQYAKPAGSITEEKPLSVLTGRDLDEIASEAKRVWGALGEGAQKPPRRAGRSTVSEPAKQRRARPDTATKRVATNGHNRATPRKGRARKSRTAERDGSANGAGEDATAGDEWAGVHLTHPDKVLFPDHGLTKRDLADYYTKVADWMLPHVAGRPLAIVRCPAGRGKPCFFQKHPGEGASEHLRRVNVAESGAAEYHVAIDDLAGLIALVQMGVLEIHVWGSRAKQLEKPDRLIFDLDPDPAVEWPDVVSAARAVRVSLEELGLTSFLKTTGGKGLHIVVPIQPRTEWDETKAFCRAVADFMVHAAPARFVATMSKAARKGKIFIDYLRNGRGATAIAAYSTRAKPGATVSTPIDWEELSSSLHSDHFTIENVPARLARLKKDPWGEIDKTKQSITAAMMSCLRQH